MWRHFDQKNNYSNAMACVMPFMIGSRQIFVGINYTMSSNSFMIWKQYIRYLSEIALEWR